MDTIQVNDSISQQLHTS